VTLPGKPSPFPASASPPNPTTPPSSPPTKFLDLGTCLGQDVRKSIHDGTPPSSIYGSDIFPAYETAGFYLFKDEEKMRGHFITADIFDLNNESALGKMKGKWDAINICMFLHQFSLEEQILICKNML
jgi:hypothetical protein